MSKTALITGASSGIGKELALEHTRAGGDSILVARREEAMLKIKEQMESINSTAVHIIPMDLVETDAPENLMAAVRERGLSVDYLINNAGFGGHGKHHERPLETELAMIELNVKALTALTRLFLTEMVERGSGRVMNVASVAGFIPGPLQAVYFATKNYVLSYSRALANELKGTGVTVTALCPGATRTEFMETANLENSMIEKMATPADKVARYGYKKMLQGKTVAVEGLMNKLLVVSRRFMPPGLVTSVARMMQEK